MNLTKRKLTDYTPNPDNLNKGTVRGLGAIEDSLSYAGVGRSLVVDRDGVILAGNHTQEAAVNVGIENVIEVETDGDAIIVHKRRDLSLKDTTKHRAEALAIADNRAAALGYDIDELRLAEMLEQLQQEDAKLLQAAGYYEDELDSLLNQLAQDALGSASAPEAQIERADELRQTWDTERGQLWIIPSKTGRGEHRLLCGDSTSAADVARVMCGEKAGCMINDPPYGMRLDADFSGAKTNPKFATEKRAFGGRRYDNVIGDHEDYTAQPILIHFDYVSEQFWFGADYYSSTLDNTMHNGCWLVWDKRLEESADLMYGSCFELLWSKQKHKRDILRHKWAGIFGVEKELEKRRFHPTQKPSSLLKDIIERYSDIDAIVVDCYAGSGTTLVACEQTGRLGRGIEIDPRYVAVTLQRLADMGLTPQLET